MKHLIKTPNILEDGMHTGVITRIALRVTPQNYRYIDIFVKPDNTEAEIPYSTPDNVSANSKLGKVFEQVQKLVPGNEVDDTLLIGKKVSFMTIQEKTDAGTFSRILDNTLKIVQ